MNSIVKLESVPSEPNVSTPDNSRLKAALASLMAAGENQQKVVAEYGNTIKKLDKSIEELRQTCKQYQQSLGRINTKPLRKKSIRLASMMTNYLDQNNPE